MSIRIMTQVWQIGPEEHYPRVVLLALADNADDAGDCYPSIALVQQKLCMSKSSVLRSLKYLEEEGWLEIEHRVTVYDECARGNLYHINLRKLGMGAPQTPQQGNGGSQARRKRTSAPQTPHSSTGVQQTPGESGMRCLERPREVSGVKSPPAPPLVGEPSEPSQNPPTPLERGAGVEADEPAVLESIAQVQQRLDAIGKSGPEWRTLWLGEMVPLQQRLFRLRGAKTPQGAAAASAQGPPAAATKAELVAWVMATCGFSEEGRRRPILAPALAGVLAQAEPGEWPGRAAEMAAAWQRYTAGPTRWGPAKFFLEGHWQHPRSWPPEGRVFDPCAARPGAAIGAMA